MAADPVQQFVLYELQTIALTIFVALYAIKIWRLMKLPVPRELPPARGSLPRAVATSYASVFIPWSMGSTRKNWGHWVAFIIYHLGILAAILATFTIPFTPGLMTMPVRWITVILITLAFGAGALKLIWRLSRPELRFVSNADDYFSLIALEIWFVVAVPAILFSSPSWLIAYFVITALLLVYVPLSKISHYIYWFFSRYLFGMRYGRRGLI